MSSVKRSSVIRDDFAIGSRVVVNDLLGTVRFFGNTSFQTGKWVGIELDEPQGKNSGIVQGKRYFECKPNHGVFVRPANVKINEDASAGSVSPSSAMRRKSVVSAPPMQRRKSIAPPSSPTVANPPQLQNRRKSTVIPSPPASINTRRKSVVSTAPLSPATNQTPIKRRPTSLLQSAPKNAPAVSSKSTVIPNARRKSIVPPKPTKTPITKRPRSDTQSLPPTPAPTIQSPSQPSVPDMAKSRTPITAPSTPENSNDVDEDIPESLMKLERDDLEIHNDDIDSYLDGSTETVSSPLSIGTETARETVSSNDQDDEQDIETAPSEFTLEPEDEEKEEQPDEGLYKPVAQPVYGSLASSRPVSKSDQTVPLKDYEELRFKLKILENKRHEDRERFREYEKVKEEAEQFLTLRNKLQDKIAELQKDVRDTKRELKEAVAEKETYEAKYTELLDSMEMLTLDKEVAEERAEDLQQEADMLKDRIEEISLDLDILKREADMINRPPELSSTDSEQRTPLEVIQLERHNERLKEALLRLRDATIENENELNSKIKLLEQDNYELEEFKIQYEKTMEKLIEAESLVDELRVQLDDTLGAEDLVDQLTERNLALTEKLDELSATVDDLEALRELADELEENHVETEKQLQAEIDHRDMLLREQLERLRANGETLLDYEATIQQFRELVALLQNDLEKFKQKEKEEESEKMTLSSQSQAMMSLNAQLQTTVMKAQAKAIDIELRKLEAMQANDRLAMIQPYLPEAFFKTENDSISCLLLFKRLEFKAALIVKHLDQNHPVSEKIMENVTENLVSICEIKQRAGWLSSLSTRFQTHIRNCDPATFATMSKVYHELIGVERRMNAIIELFRVDQINESHCLTELQRVISQVEHMVETYLKHQEKANSDQFFGLTKALDLNADRMIVIFTFVKQSLNNAIKIDGLSIAEGLGELDMNYSEPLGRLIAFAKNSKIIAKKLMRQLEDKLEEAMTLKSEHLHRFKMLYAISAKLCTFCFETCRDITAYIDTKRGSHEQIELAHIQKLIGDKSDQIFEIAESSMWESALRTLKTLINELETTFSQVERDDKLEKISSSVAPWIQRASDIKAEVVVNHELEHKLQQHSEEIIKLIKDVRLKDQALQESDVKISLLEKRMEMAKKEMEHIKTLEEDLEKSMNQEQLYAEAMENLQHEYEALEAKNIELKKEMSKREEKRQSLLRKATFDLAEVEGDSDVQEMAGGYYEMSGQLERLRASIRYLRAENAELKSIDFVRALDLQPISKSSTSKSQHQEQLTEIARETRALVKDLRSAGASPRIVQLETRESKNTSHLWQSMKKSPDYQYQTQQSVLYTLKQRSMQLRRKVDNIQKIENDSPPVYQKIPLQQSQQQVPLGKIKIPKAISTDAASLNNTLAKRCIDIRSFNEFKRLHTIFC